MSQTKRDSQIPSDSVGVKARNLEAQNFVCTRPVRAPYFKGLGKLHVGYCGLVVLSREKLA